MPHILLIKPGVRFNSRLAGGGFVLTGCHKVNWPNVHNVMSAGLWVDTGGRIVSSNMLIDLSS